MTGVVLLYVGVVLIVNGIWLIGQARAAAAAARMPAMETAAVGSTVRGGGYAGEAAAGQELGGEAVAVPPPRGAEANPLFIQNREVAILNIFTGFIGLVIAITFIVDGGLARIPAEGLPSIRGGGAILLFAFTYLWVAYNQYANAGGGGSAGTPCSSLSLRSCSAFTRCRPRRAATPPTCGWPAIGSPGQCCGACSGHCCRWNCRSPASRGGWPSSKAGTAWALAIALLWGKLAFA